MLNRDGGVCRQGAHRVQAIGRHGAAQGFGASGSGGSFGAVVHVTPFAWLVKQSADQAAVRVLIHPPAAVAQELSMSLNRVRGRHVVSKISASAYAQSPL